MAYLGSWKIDDLLTFPANTHTASTGAATDADAVPDYRVYEDETGTAILTGSMAKLDDANTTGFYSEQLTLSAANGLEKGKCYTIYVSAVVGGVTGTMAHTFQIEAEVDANTVSPTVSANAIQISGDSVAADNAEAFFDGTGYAGTGNTIPTVTTVTTVNGLAANSVTASVIASNAIDADALAADVQTELRSLVSGTSDSGTTTTMVDADRTEADTDYWKGAWILFTSGNISGQARLITGFTPGTDTITFTPATTQAVATQTYEILPAGSIDIGSISGDATAADNAEAFFDGTGYAGTNNVMPTTTTVTNTVNANTVQLSGDTTAADNAEAFFDGTGYAGTGNTIPTVTTVTNGVNVSQISGDSVAADNAEAFFDGTGYAGTGNTIPTVTTTGTATAVTTVNGLATAAVDNILDRAMAAELASLPSQTVPTVRQMLQSLYQHWRNRYTITATAAVNYKADGTTALKTSTVSDDATTVVRGAGS